MSDTTLRYPDINAAAGLANGDEVLVFQPVSGNMVVRRTNLSALRGHVVKAGANITIGADGTIAASQGAWLNGSGVPDPGVGSAYDYYLRTTNGDLYQKSGGGTWSVIANLRGAAGTVADFSAANVAGNFSVATNKFTVAAASGNAAIAGTLGVTGASTLAALTATTGTFSGDFAVGASKFTVAAASGNTVAVGSVSGAAFIPTSATLPTGGIYRPAADTVGVVTASTERLRVNSTGDVGIGTASPDARLHVVGQSAKAASAGYLAYVSGSQTAANTASFAGVSVHPSYTSALGALALFAGAVLAPVNAAAGSVTAMAGLRAIPSNASTGTVTAMYGVEAVPLNAGAATVTSAYGLYSRIDNSNAGGTIGTAYGLYLATPNNSGTISARYGVYQQDPTAPNLFAGSVTGASLIPSSATVPSNGLYLPAGNTLGFAVNTTAAMRLTGSALSPAVGGAIWLGTTTLRWGGAHFDTGAVLNFENGDVTITHAASLLTVEGGAVTVKTHAGLGDFFVEGVAGQGAPAVRARGYRGDANGSVWYGGQVIAEAVRTDAMFASGKVIGALIFGGNTDLTPTMGYTASITGVADATWVNAGSAATAIVFRTGVAAQARAADVAFGTDRGRITSGGRWLLGSSTDDGSTVVQANGTFKATGASTLAGLTATTGAFSGDFAVNTNKFTVAAASGNTVVGGTLTVTGLVTLSSISTGAIAGTTGNFSGNFAVATNKFTVAAASGNTTVAGTLGVTGASTLAGLTATTIVGTTGAFSGDFAVATAKFMVAAASGNTTVAGTLSVAGAATLAGMTATTGAFSGDVAVATSKFTVAAASGNTAVAGTLGVTGATTMAGLTATTGAFSGSFAVATNKFTVSSVTGNTYVAGAFEAIGASTLAGLSATTGAFSGDFNVNTNKFTVAAASGNTVVGGALGVTGATTLNALTATTIAGTTGDFSGDLKVNTDKFTVTAASGNTVVAGTLGVTGASTLAAVTATTIAGTTGSFSGDFKVNTNKFTVASASGNTVVAGTLGVTGASTLAGVTATTIAGTTGDFSGNFAVATNKFTVAAATGNTVVAGALGVTGASTLAAVTATTIAGTTGSFSSDLKVNTNKFTVAAASGNTVVAGTLGVTGASTLAAVTATTGAFSGDVAVNTNKFTVAAASGNTVVAGTLGVTGASTLAGLTATTIAGTTGTFSGDFNVNTNKFTVAAASGNTVVAGTLGVTGATTLAGLTATSIAGTTGGFSGDFAVATNKFTVAAASGSTAIAGSVTGASFIPFSPTVPANGMYLPAGNTLGFAINLAAEMQLTSTALSPAVSDGLALGSTSLMWSDAFFASGSALNFNNGDVTLTHASNLLTMAGGGFTFSSSRVQGDFLVETGDTVNGAPGIRVRGYRSDSNGSIDFGGQFFAEGVRTDALFASGKAFGGLIFGGNTDLTPTMGYTASITGVADAAWVDTSNAATAIVFRTGTSAQARGPNINYGTERGRITSGGRWLLGSATDDSSTTVQVNGTFKATGASTLAALSATTGTFSSTLGVTGASTLAALSATTGAFSGDVAVATNKFTVASASGNTVVAGTLGVTSNLAVATNKFTVAAASGNTAVAGTLVATGALTSSTSTTTKILNIAPGAHDLAGQYSASTAPLSMSMSLPRPSVVPLGKRNIVQWAVTNDVVAPDAVANQGGSLNFFDVTQRSGFRLPKNTNSTTAAGNATLNFASTTGITAGMFIDDASGGIPAGSTVVSTTATTVVSSAVAVGAGVTSGAAIVFRGLVANSWSGPRTIARFTWAEDNHPVEQLSGSEGGQAHPSVNVTWSTIRSTFNRGGDQPMFRHSRGSNFLDYGMILHASGATNLQNSRLYEGALFFQPNTSVRVAFGWTLHTPTTDGTAPTEAYIAYTTRKSNNANLSWRGVFLLGDEGIAGIDAMRGTLLGYRSSHADPKPKAFIGVDLADVNFSGRAMRWIGGDISGGAHGDAGAGRLRLGNGFLTPTATGLQIDAVGYRGSPAGTIFSLGGSLVNGNPVVEIRPNSVGDDAYGGTYHFYSPDYANNQFNRVMVLNPPTTNGAAPSNPIEVKLRHNSSAQVEFPVTDIATTTAHPTELTATSATAYNGLYLAYYTGACAGEKQLISGFDPATRILTTAAFSQVPTTAINLITNYRFESVLPTIENSILNGWQYTLNGNMSLVTNGTTSVGNATLNFANTVGIAVGMVIADVSGGIPPGSTVVSMTSTTVVSSAVAVGAGVASGVAIAFQGAGGTGTVVRDLDGFTTAQLTGDGTNAASLDQSITWPANSEGLVRIFAAGPYRVKLGTTRGSSDIHFENIDRAEPPEGEDYPRISEDIQFSSAGTTLWLRIETKQTIPVRISNVRCADVASGSAILNGVRAGVEAVPLTVNHTWTQRNTLELQPGAGPATFGGTLGVSGNFAVATNKFTVAAASGNTGVAGTLGVTGASTLAALSATTGAFSGDVAVATNKFTVASASGNTVVAGTLGVTGATTLAGLSATTGAFSGDFAVATNKFTVAAASGNTVVAGTLGVTGASTLAGLSATTIAGTTGSFSGNFAVATNKFTVAAASGNTGVAGTLGVTGASTLAALSATTGAFSGDVAVATNKFTVASASGNTVVAGTLGVTGATTLAGLSATTGAFSGDFAVATNKFTVAAASGNTVVAGTLGVTGASTLAGLSATTIAGTTGSFSSTATATAFIPTIGTAPSNGLYLPATNTLGWAINSAAEMQLTSTALSPAVSDGLALGSTSLMWSDAFFASGSALNFNNGDVTLTHAAENLKFDGGKLTATYNSTDASGSTQILTVVGNQSVAHTGNYFAAVLTPTYSAASGNTLAGLFGLYTAANNTSTGTVTQAFGLSANAVNDAGGTITLAQAVSGVTVNSSSGTVTNANGGRFQVFNTSTGTITTAYGVYSGLTNTNAGGTVTTFYGAFLATPTNSGTIVNRYGVYQQDAASQNVLFGRTLVGSATDDASTALQVNGTFKATGASTLAALSATTIAGTTGSFSGDFAVATNKFTVAAASGNTEVAGTLGVTGASTLAALSATTGTFSSTATATAFIPTTSATVPTNGMYLPATNSLAWATNSTEDMRLNATGDLGVGTNAPTTRLHVYKDQTSASGNTINFRVAGSQTVASTGAFQTAQLTGAYTASSGNTLATLIGLLADPSNSGTGAVTTLHGIRSGPQNTSTGTVANLFGVASIPLNSGAGTVTSAYGVLARVDNTNVGGTITSVYGVYVGTPSNSGTIVNNWGVYQENAAAKNAFFGRTLIGGTTDDASTNLQVNGTFKATGASTLAALSATTGAFTGVTTVNLSGTSLTSIAGYVFGAAAADGFGTSVVLDAAGIYPRYVLRRTNGTSASRTAIVLDDILGSFEGRGYDGSAFTTLRAGIDFVAAENWSGAAQGGKIAFRTTTNGAITGAQVKMTLENRGVLLIGGTIDDGTNKLRVSGGITVDTGNSYKVNNVAVVGATKTGWTAATGTATRTTFATATVTLEQLAQRVKALLDDLISHGLIGA